MIERHFMLDNNVLVALTKSELNSEIVKSRCRVPAAVVAEAAGWHGPELLVSITYDYSESVFGLVSEVMQTIHTSNKRLVNYSRNKGTADPFVIASALDATEQSQEKLVQEEWHVVSEDNEVRRVAALNGLSSLRKNAFLSLIRSTDLTSLDDIDIDEIERPAAQSTS